MKQVEISDLMRAQMQFMEHVAMLLFKAEDLGFRVTGGDLYRDPRCPYGSLSSRHRSRLAIDLNLFKTENGVTYYCDQTEDHQPLGEYWESIGGLWGGRFNDGNHYEWPLPKVDID